MAPGKVIHNRKDAARAGVTSATGAALRRAGRPDGRRATAGNTCGPRARAIASARPFTAETAEGAEKNLFFKTVRLQLRGWHGHAVA